MKILYGTGNPAKYLPNRRNGKMLDEIILCNPHRANELKLKG